MRANGDTAEDAAKARSLGAEGIGLCRTEHMFFGEDRGELVRGMFVAAARWRRAEVHAAADGGPAPPELESAREEFHQALEHLGELQRADFAAILHEMRGLPVTVRLLDPPLHEFLPLEHFEAEVRRLEAAADDRLTDAREAAEIVRDLQEANPMLGTRGVRLAFLYPQIYEMQVRAVIAAAAEAAEAGDFPHVEIMIPLVAYETELRQLREHVVNVAEEARRKAASEVPYSVGTMIELPRACLIAGHIARHADFFSFGTNDLTQTTIGLSRDDVEGSFMPSYLAGRIIDRSPFEVIDGPGVGELVRIGAERGREANPELKLGICGEHGGDPTSIRFFDSIGLDYVSCSPYRTPVARVAAAQAAIERGRSEHPRAPSAPPPPAPYVTMRRHVSSSSCPGGPFCCHLRAARLSRAGECRRGDPRRRELSGHDHVLVPDGSDPDLPGAEPEPVRGTKTCPNAEKVCGPGDTSVFAPGSNAEGYVTRFQPSMVEIQPDGELVTPSVWDLHLHHVVWLAPNGGPTFASGEEKTMPKLPQGYGFKVGGDATWGLNYMIHALTADGGRQVYITWEIDWVPETDPARTDINQADDQVARRRRRPAALPRVRRRARLRRRWRRPVRSSPTTSRPTRRSPGFEEREKISDARQLDRAGTPDGPWSSAPAISIPEGCTWTCRWPATGRTPARPTATTRRRSGPCSAPTPATTTPRGR